MEKEEIEMEIEERVKKHSETEKKLMVLAKIAHRLNEAHLTWALGASTLLYFKGITDRFNDLDLMAETEETPAVCEILKKMGKMHPENRTAQYATKYFYEFTVDGVEIDLMGGFAIVKDGVIHDCSLKQENVTESADLYGECIPLESVHVWRRYYELMGREKKVKMIDDFFAGGEDR